MPVNWPPAGRVNLFLWLFTKSNEEVTDTKSYKTDLLQNIPIGERAMYVNMNKRKH